MDSNAAQFSREDDNDCQLVPAAAVEEPSRPPGSGSEAASGNTSPGCQSTTQGNSSHPLLMDGYPNYLVSGGIDWFEWTGLIDFTKSSNFESLVAEFQRIKEFCQANRRAHGEAFIAGFGSVQVGRHGVNRGGERGQHFEFRIRTAGAMYGLSSRSGEALKGGRRKQQVNFYVLQTGRDCLLIGAQEGFARAMQFLESLGGTPLELKISRGDLCLDISNLPTSDLNQLVAAGHFVTLANDVHPNINFVTNKVTGFAAGKSPMRLSVYDKYIERLGKADALYNQALIDRRWYGEIRENATRIEYQMHRRWLLDQGINTPQDFLDRRGALCEKLSHDWFRITAEPVDRRNKHQSRAALHPMWIGVQRAFVTIFGPPESRLSAIQRLRVSPQKLMEQGRGCLANALLQMDMPFETYHEFAERCKQLLLALPASKAQAADFITELVRRKMEFETS